MTAQQVYDFWFDPANKPCWFRSTEEFDQQIRVQFEPTWRAARDDLLRDWESTSTNALALVIVLDQFPLNMFRDQALSFSTEEQSRKVALRAIERGFDQQLKTPAEKAFMYLPFMHSEDLVDQDRSIALFTAADMNDNLRWARHHKGIVQRFGRFPHRNAVLGRENTPDEHAWLVSEQAFHG